MHENGYNRPFGPWSLARALGVIVLLLASAAMAAQELVPLTTALLESAAATTPNGWVLRDLVVAGACLVADLAVGALTIGGVATALNAVRQSNGALDRCSRLAPVALRRLVLSACGITLAIPVMTGTSTAAPGDPAQGPRSPSPSDSRGLSGLPLPDLPTSSTPEPQARRSTVLVRPDDSLWSISVRLLGPHAGVAQIAHHVNELYALNAHLIGPDPDLIMPGTELTTVGGTR